MPPAKKKFYRPRRQAKKRVARKPVVVHKRSTNLPEYASLSVKRSYGNNNTPLTVNSMYGLMNIQLAGSGARITNVAQAYQHFRIRNVKLTIKSPFDVFSPGTSGSKLNLYYMIDKSGSLPANPTLESLKQMGAKAYALDEKPFVISWKPSVLTVDMTQGGATGLVQASQYKISPWLSTSAVPVGSAWSANNTDHLGVYFYIEQYFTPANTTIPIQVEVECQFEFKKPLSTSTANAELYPTIAITPIEENTSADGLVGGGDEQ